MAKKRKKQRKATQGASDPISRFLRPTAAREAHNDFQSAGAAYRVKSVIADLLERGKITRAEFDKLDYYREQAHQAEDDMKQAGPLDPGKLMGGGGGTSTGGTIPAIMLGTPAILETSRIERDVGPRLRPILQAIVRDDWTLNRWCIHKHGGRERYKTNSKGEEVFVALVPIAEKRVKAEALLDLKYAAGAFAK